jgi:acyl-coenzyme A synthetase/AMP-(fatty) acid ligase
MKMPQNNPSSLWSALVSARDLSGCFVASAGTRVALSDLIAGSALDGRGDELRGRSVLILTKDQLIAALALFELDGIARRIVLYPPDLPLEYLPTVIESANVDAIVSDQTTFGPKIPHVRYFMPCARAIVPQNCDRSSQHETEWILLTSGTLGPPKLVVHTLSGLAGAIQCSRAPAGQVIWSTFYDIRRYGGLQIFLRAALTGTSLVLSSGLESTGDFLARAGSLGVTHISGTPSQWRRALMSPSAHLLSPAYIRLSGEIADQAILNHLRSVYPQADVVHAFASTEAGVVFEVHDGIAGFPATVIEGSPGVDMKIEDNTLKVRSSRTATHYLGSESSTAIRDTESFVDTGDMVEARDDRYYFVGRRDGVINVGGLKVHPEEVEAVINRHPEVEMSLVRTKKNPITGALVVADVVLKATARSVNHDARELQHDILLFCRGALSSYKVPAAVYFVPTLAISESGKLLRLNA